MDSVRWTILGFAVAIVAVLVAAFAFIGMPGAAPQPAAKFAQGYDGVVPASALMRVPVTGVYPGGNPTGLNPNLQNPLANDPDAIARGMKDFDSFNCSGCHAANAGGGMGPSLSNDTWIYRSSPGNIYMTIFQGRSAGMPAFGAMLPDRTIWELVAYIKSISEKPGPNFGKTTNNAAPAIEQVPAGQMATPTPWKFTEPMPPNGEKPGSENGPS
ncbi:MAG TPA: cytochrome c [Rhizomicrobium sp.]|jgi:cytochrome c oxidase cbb3-type subunit 3